VNDSDYMTALYIFHVVGVRECGGNAEDSGETCNELSSKFDDGRMGGGDTTGVVETLPMNHD
jgi:hypothetical protein